MQPLYGRRKRCAHIGRAPARMAQVGSGYHPTAAARGVQTGQRLQCDASVTRLAIGFLEQEGRMIVVKDWHCRSVSPSPLSVAAPPRALLDAARGCLQQRFRCRYGMGCPDGSRGMPAAYQRRR